jgi:hypothetical protein
MMVLSETAESSHLLLSCLETLCKLERLVLHQSATNVLIR